MTQGLWITRLAVVMAFVLTCGRQRYARVQHIHFQTVVAVSHAIFEPVSECAGCDSVEVDL